MKLHTNLVNFEFIIHVIFHNKKTQSIVIMLAFGVQLGTHYMRMCDTSDLLLDTIIDDSWENGNGISFQEPASTSENAGLCMVALCTATDMKEEALNTCTTNN
ncbi:hypothetical protein AAHE18_09G118000 [Arachis hypogaea]